MLRVAGAALAAAALAAAGCGGSEPTSSLDQALKYADPEATTIVVSTDLES